MPYKTLYHRRQNEADYLPRKWYYDDALELSWVKDITIKRSKKLPKNILRGLFVASGPKFNGSNLTASYTIILADGLPQEVERVVTIKELMHCYFGPDFGGRYATDSQIALDNHLKKFFGNSYTTHSHAVEAEHKALWMALGVLCPEHRRQEWKREAEASADQGKQVIQEIASTLKIPLHHAAALMGSQFETEIAAILD